MKKRKDYITDIFYTMKISKTTFYKHLKNILTEKQYTIFKMRFDNNGNIKMTSEEIANQLGTTRQAIDSILNKIYAKTIILCKRLNIDVDINQKIEKPVEVSEPTLSKHASELISSIIEFKRLPGEKRLNNMVSEKVFSDNGADQRSYYDHLQVDVNRINEKIERNEELSELEKKKLYDYNAISEVLKRYKPKRKQEKRKYDFKNVVYELRIKTIEFIKELNRCHKLPESRFADEFSVGKKFNSGTDQRMFYDSLRHKGKQAKIKFNNGEILTTLNKEKIISLKLIDNVLSFYPSKFFHNKLLIMDLASSLGIDVEKNKLLFSKYYGEVYVKIRFLIENNIFITDNNGFINPIMFMSDSEMIDNYNVSNEELTDKYLNGLIDSELSKEVIKKLSKKIKHIK